MGVKPCSARRQRRPQGCYDRPVSTPTLVTLRNVSVCSDNGPVLGPIDFVWRAGEHWVLSGRAGSGKSVLAEVLAGAVRPSRGERSYPTFAADYPDARLGILPRGLAQVVSHRLQQRVAAQQVSFHQARWHEDWTEPLDVDCFLEPASVFGIRPYEIVAPDRIPEDFAERKRLACARLGLEPLLSRRIAHLSNGELRRALLARAWLARPRLLVLDDPLGSLDQEGRLTLTECLRVWATEGIHLLITTPRPEEFRTIASHACILERGGIARQGPFEECFGATPAPLTTPAREPHPPGDARQPLHGGTRAEGRTRVADEHSLPGEITPASLVVCRQVTVRAGDKRLLAAVDWVVNPGEHWLVTGPNGAGKSTLFAVLVGDHPQAYANDVRVCGLRLGPGTSLWDLRRKLGFMSPELVHHYPTGWSALEVVSSGFERTLGVYAEQQDYVRETARGALDQLGLSAQAPQRFGSLSESQQRRVLLARALMGSPRVLLLDEPTQGLEPGASEVVVGAIEEALAHTGLSVLLVTHRPEERPRGMTHHLELREGRVVRRGTLAGGD